MDAMSAAAVASSGRIHQGVEAADTSPAALGVSVTIGSAVGFIAETGVARSMKYSSRQPSLPVYFSRVAQASLPNLAFHSA